MLGALIGDHVGSRFEWHPHKDKSFDLLHGDCSWTDDTVLTIAVAQALATDADMAETLRRYTLLHVTSYGLHYRDWANGRLGGGPYGSYGNGASMRVSPAAWFARNADECIAFADRSASATHNHPEGMRGARTVALAVYAALSGWTQEEIRTLVARTSGYDMSPDVDSIRREAGFELKSWISVPRAIICALEARDFEDAIRNAVSMGGDADTEAAIAGSIAEALFPVPDRLAQVVLEKLPDDLQADFARLSEGAGTVTREPLVVAKADSLPVWDPDCMKEWQPPHPDPVRIIVYEPDPIPEAVHAPGLFSRAVSWLRAR